MTLFPTISTHIQQVINTRGLFCIDVVQLYTNILFARVFSSFFKDTEYVEHMALLDIYLMPS